MGWRAPFFEKSKRFQTPTLATTEFFQRSDLHHPTRNELENKIHPLKNPLNFFLPEGPDFYVFFYVFFRCFVGILCPNPRFNVDISRALPMLGIRIAGCRQQKDANMHPLSAFGLE